MEVLLRCWLCCNLDFNFPNFLNALSESGHCSNYTYMNKMSDYTRQAHKYENENDSKDYIRYDSDFL